MKALQVTLVVTISLIIVLLVFACGQTGSRRMPDRALSQTSIDVASALAELDAMHAPEGVTPALFAQIKDALRAALIARGTNKIACTPPTGAANHIPGIQLTDAGGGMYNLVWRYYNNGDYNQDGSVGIADITPLAMHYGEGWIAGEENTLAAVVDGSGNNIVDISDVTPIAMNFGVECESYAVQSSDAEDGTFTLVDNVYLDTGTGKDTGRMTFTYNFAPTPALWYRVVAQDSALAPGEGSGAVLAGGGNQPPVAGIWADHYMGYAPSTVDFEGNTSADADGTIVLYEWDADGDGVFEGNTGATPEYRYVYNAVGDYTASLRVTDDGGATNTASMTINVYANPGYDEIEDNDAPDDSATHLPAIPFSFFTASIGENLPAYIGYDGDYEDYFSFNANEGDTLTFVMSWSFSDYGGRFAIIDSDGDTLHYIESDTAPVQLCYTFAPGDTAPFYLEVYSYWGFAEYELKGVEGAPPVADLVATPTHGPQPLLVNFDASGSSADVVDYSWDYRGDGNHWDGGAIETHDYNETGWFLATVDVADADGLTDSASVLITVGDIGYDEIENNDSFTPVDESTPLPAIPFSGFRGSIGDNDLTGYHGYDGDYSDYYLLDSVEGDTITAHCYFDAATAHPFIALYDSEGDVLNELSWEDPLVIVYQFAPGDLAPYYLGVFCNEPEYTDYTIDIDAGSAPTADITANPLEGDAPLEVTFDARWSYDYDGGIISTYDWDWNGDGTWDDTTVDAFPVLHTFTADGLYQTILRVTDEEGQQDEDIIWIFVPNAQAYYDEDEPNDSVATANQLPPFDFADWHGSVGYNDHYYYVGYDGGGNDCLLFDTVGEGDTVHFHATFDAYGGEMNLALWDSDSNLLAVDGSTSEIWVDYTFTGDEVFPCYLRMRNVGGFSGGDYWLDGQLT